MKSYILLTVFLFTACNNMNKSHRITTTANLNLKENITSVIENHFGIISPDNHNPDPYASNTINKIEYHFTDNKLTDISVSIKTQDEQDYRVEQQHFNINNPESDLYSETTSNEETLSKSYVIYDKPDSMLMRIERGGDGENSVLNFYDENGLLARQETKFTEIKILDVNTYNKNNDLEKVERIANYENGETENQTITYQYLEFDDNKNWIKRIRYSGYHFYTMETRTINYLKTK